MSLESVFQLFYGEVPVAILVDLFEDLPELVNFLLRELGGYVGHGDGFELNSKRWSTFEKLQNCFNFLKSSFRQS